MSVVLVILVGFLEVLGGTCSFSLTPLTGGTVISNINNTGNTIPGTSYNYEAWTDAYPPDGTIPNGKKPADFNITLYGVDSNGNPTAAFKASWKDSSDFLARTGLQMDEGKKYTEYGNLIAEYAYTRSPWRNATFDPADIAGANPLDGGVAGDYSYIGVYGWTRNPLVEYYIVDDWFGNRWQTDTTNVGEGTICYDYLQEDPPRTCVVNTINVDGSDYIVYKHHRDAYSIEGEGEFDQYFSVRVNPRKCGTISVTEHFKKWEALDLTMQGSLYEVKLLAEAGGGEGSIDYSYAAVKSIVTNDPPSSASSIAPMTAVLILLAVFWLF